MASDFSLASRDPADEVTTQPTAMAVLSGDSPARAPPAAPITTRDAIISGSQRRRVIHATQATAETPSATAIAVPLAPEPSAGWASGTVSSTTTSTRILTRSRIS